MTDRRRLQWEALGRSDPYWAVLSDPSKRGGRWEREEFFRTGRDEVEAMLARLSELGVEVRFGTALDFGCGVGRLTRALAARFERVLGVDISESMLAEARAANGDVPNVAFLRNDGDALDMVDRGTIDLVYSNIALQHIPRRGQRRFVREFCRVVRPGVGVVVFQTPSRPKLSRARGWAHLLAGNRLLNVLRVLRYGRRGVMEVHPFPRRRVQRLLSGEGLSLVRAEREGAAGPAFVSFRYHAVKDAPA